MLDRFASFVFAVLMLERSIRLLVKLIALRNAHSYLTGSREKVL